MIENTELLADPSRLDAVVSYDLDSAELRRRLDELAARTAAELRFPISLVTILLDSAALFAGSHGLVGWLAETGGAPAEWSFCTTTVLTGAPYVVPDAGTDPVQHDNPVVTVDGAGSYAGVPLRASNGQVIGSHCVIGVDPHEFTPEELAVLEAAADEAMAILEEHRLEEHRPEEHRPQEQLLGS